MIIVEFSYTSRNIDEIMLIRRVFAQNERIWQKKVSRSEILIVKVDDLTRL